MAKSLTNMLGLTIVGAGLLFNQGCATAQYPQGLTTDNEQNTSKEYTGEVKIDKLKMPDGSFYAVYKSPTSPYGFKFLPPQMSEKIRVGLEGTIHTVTGDFYELYDEDGSDKEDRLVYIRNKNAQGFERTGNLSLAASISGKENVTARLKRYKGKEGGYIVEVNGIGREFFDSRTIDGREFLIMHDVRGTGKERLEWYFIPVDGLKLELTGKGEISFISDQGVYSTRKMPLSSEPTKPAKSEKSEDGGEKAN